MGSDYLNKIFEFTDNLIDKHIKNPKLNSMLKKVINLEMFLYIVFGVLTTVVNLVVFKIFEKLLGTKFALITNIIAWIAAVAFAFVTNKFLVFRSKSTESQTLLKEIISFTAARLFSLGVEEAGLAVAQFVFHADEKKFILGLTGTMVAKLILQIIVVIMNYVFSKLYIFKDKEAANEDELSSLKEDETKE